MYSLFRKEINQFFGSLIGYLVIAVFLLSTGLFLWVFNGNYNIPDGGYATLDGLFSMAPWVYLFLIPAVTMRMFADEKRTGTLELLLTRPLSSFQLVGAKYLAALVVVALSLLPTLLYFFSVYQLGNPVGSIDTGATWGSYLGLFFLAAIYLSIGLFASSLTDNQIVAFILSLFLSFFWYTGFDFVAGLPIPSGIAETLLSLGINQHYESVSRGVLDSRDLYYFLAMVGLFLLLTQISLFWKRYSKKQAISRLGIYIVATTFAAILMTNHFFRIDFTAEKRFTLAEQTRKIMEEVDQPAIVNVYLKGDMLPAGFRKLAKAVKEKLLDMNVYAGAPVHVQFIDPYQDVKPSQRKGYFDSLIDEGLKPTDLRIKTDQGTSTRLIFPSAVVRLHGHEVVVNFLQNDPSLPAEENLNRSIELLEYQFARAFRVLMQHKKQKVAFLTGHHELSQWQVKDISNALSENYDVVRITPDDLLAAPDSFRAVIVADPEKAFPERDKFALDQYAMKGGRLMWLIDPVQVSMDSLSEGMMTLAFPRNLNLQDQLFHYGVRLNHDLIQDVQCRMIPVNTALTGQPPKFTPAPWYFSPLLMPSQNSPVGKNLNRLMADFVSSLELVGENQDVKKTVLLTSSAYSRTTETPMEVSLDMINEPPARELFTQHYIPVGVLLEGKFSSVFKNRMLNELHLPAGMKPRYESPQTKMMVFSDGNLIANKVHETPKGVQILPLGYDRYAKQTFGNKAFFVNAVQYLCDDSGLMELRTRTVKLRLLDKVKLREEKLKWQLLNLLVPVLFILLFGVVFNFIRRKRYAH